MTFKPQLKLRISLTILVLLSSILVIPKSMAQDTFKNIKVASEEWEDSTNKDGTGLYWDILRAVYKPQGIKVSTQVTSYSRSMKLVQNKKIDAAVGAYQNEVSQVLYPNKHLDADLVSALYKKGSVNSWKGEKSLEGKHVGWIKGYSIDKYITKNFKVHELMDREKAVRKLDAGNLDFFLDGEWELNSELEKGYVNKGEYIISKLKQLNTYVVFADNARGQHFKKVYDDGIEKLLANGELSKLFDKWDSQIPFDGAM